MSSPLETGAPLRLLVLAALAVLVAVALMRPRRAPSPRINCPYRRGQRPSATTSNGGSQGWQVVDGRWTVEEVAGTSSGQRALVQRETKKSYDVVVAPAGPFGDVDATLRFKPMSGREDASGGIVFRFHDGAF
jgi:hypothetical protein